MSRKTKIVERSGRQVTCYFGPEASVWLAAIELETKGLVPLGALVRAASWETIGAVAAVVTDASKLPRKPQKPTD